MKSEWFWSSDFLPEVNHFIKKVPPTDTHPIRNGSVVMRWRNTGVPMRVYARGSILVLLVVTALLESFAVESVNLRGGPQGLDSLLVHDPCQLEGWEFGAENSSEITTLIERS